MSAATLHLPRSAHHSPRPSHEIHTPRHYPRLAPSSGHSNSEKRSPMTISPAPPARPASGASTDATSQIPRRVEERPTHVSQPHPSALSGQRSKPVSPVSASKTTEARPPPSTTAPTMPEVKAERAPSPGPPPPSATPAGARRRPQKLDLDTSGSVMSGRPSAPLTARESGTISSMQEAATACLSPGFDTSDPTRRLNVERARDMAEQQRALIAQRQMESGGKGANSSGSRTMDAGGPPPTSGFSKPTLGPQRKKAPPSSLALGGHSYHNEPPRVIQSAPLNQTFTGLNRAAHPLSRQVLEHSHQHAMGYGQTPNPRDQDPHHYPHPSTPQHSTRLPPITDVFANERLNSGRPSAMLNRTTSGPSAPHERPAQLYAPLVNKSDPAVHRTNPDSADPSPARPPPFDPLHPDYPPPRSSNHESFMRSTAVSHPSQPHRSGERERRDFRSSEEALHTLAGGREELLPKVVHYGGHQPPTPPSPLPPMGYPPTQSEQRAYQSQPNLKVEYIERERNERRRTRDDFERDHEEAGAEEAERGRERSRRRAEDAHPAQGLGFGYGAWSGARDARSGGQSPATMRRKKEEFMGLMARAWDLLHE